MKTKAYLLFCAIFLMTGGLFSGASAQEALQQAAAGQKTISVIKVKGNKAISSATVLSKIKAKPGDVFSQELLNADLKRLFGLGFFTDISIETEDYETGVAVTFVVAERPLISQILFIGNRAYKPDKLKKEIKSSENDMLDETKLKGDIEIIKEMYKKKGYQLADAKYDIKVDGEKNTARVTFTIDEKTRVRIRKVYFTGNRAMASKQLLKSMSTRPDTLFTSGYLKEDVLATDLEKLKYLYETKGYLDVNITHKIDYDYTGRWIVLTIQIEEGKKYTVGAVAIKGNAVFPEKELRLKLTMGSGQAFNPVGLRQDTGSIQQFYYQKGYMMAQVDPATSIDAQTGRVDIVYNITENELIYVDKIKIKGNTKTRDIVIRRELRVYPGEKFDGDKLRRSKERLYNLGFFEEVSFDTEAGGAPNKQDLVVTVKETKTGELSFGGGFSSVEQLVGFASISQKNFDLFNFPAFTGDGQQLKFMAEFGTIRQNYELSWTEPWIFDMPLLFGFDAYNKTRLRRSGLGYGFDEVRQGGDIRFGKDLTDYLHGSLVYVLENVDISNISEGASADLMAEEGKNRISKGILGLAYDGRDSVYNPTKGLLLGGGVEYASKFIDGTKEFVKYSANTAVYFTHFSKLVLELKGFAGAANAYGESTKVPIYERYYAGGSETIRGYRERHIGPKDPNSGDPVGGEGIIVGNAEYTFPIYEKFIKGAVFYDIGNVWEKWEDIGRKGFKSGTGAGVRVKTPIGPLRLDYGFPLSDVAGERKKPRLHFTVSQGF